MSSRIEPALSLAKGGDLIPLIEIATSRIFGTRDDSGWERQWQLAVVG